MEKINWTEVGKGHLNLAPDPQMLTPEGLDLVKHACLKGERASANRSITIKYDRLFVIKRIIMLCSRPIAALTLEAWLELCTEVWEIHQENLNETN